MQICAASQNSNLCTFLFYQAMDRELKECWEISFKFQASLSPGVQTEFLRLACKEKKVTYWDIFSLMMIIKKKKKAETKKEKKHTNSTK